MISENVDQSPLIWAVSFPVVIILFHMADSSYFWQFFLAVAQVKILTEKSNKSFTREPVTSNSESIYGEH